MILPLRIKSVYQPTNPPRCGNLDCLCPLERPFREMTIRAELGKRVCVTELLLCVGCWDRYAGRELTITVED